MYPQKMTWPNGKKAAAMVTIEMDNEFFWLGLDAKAIARPKTLSMGTFGTTRGLDRVFASLENAGVKATFFILGIFAERYPDVVKRIQAAGHEIALHGYEHLNYSFLSTEEQYAEIQRGIGAVTKVTGTAPVGFRLPEGNMTFETMGIIDSFGFKYDSSLLDYDLPYWMLVDGKESKTLEIPMNWEMQDTTEFAFNFFPPYPVSVDAPASYSETLKNWQREMKAYREYSLCYVCKFDPQTIGSFGRIGMFDELLRGLKANDFWIATGSQIADYAIQTMREL